MVRADGFIDSARTLVNTPTPYAPGVGLLGWQAAELGLKALSEGHGIPFKHDLKLVIDHLKKNNVLDDPTYGRLQNYVVTVTSSGSYNDLRYPEQNQRFWEEMPPPEIRLRFDAAVNIVRICREKLES
jgi:hypothetical protein